MDFIMILRDPNIAQYVCSFEGITPFVDLETHGKAERQGHLNSWKSSHTFEDVSAIKEAVPDAHLIVRINPMHDQSAAEISEVVARGADSVMLPMFFEKSTLARFMDILGDKAQPYPLFETASSVTALPEMVSGLGVNRLHIGLNDLTLDLKKNFLFQPIADNYLERPARYMRERNIYFGIGGIARANEGIVSPEYLLGEHVRLGSSAAILSQTFHRNAATLEQLLEDMDFGKELEKLHGIYNTFVSIKAEELEKNRVVTRNRIYDVVQLLQKRRTE